MLTKTSYDEKAFQLQTLEIVLKSGFEMTVIDKVLIPFQDLLGASKYRLITASHLFPENLSALKQDFHLHLLNFLKNQHITVHFDGATHWGKLVGVVLRVIQDIPPAIIHLAVHLFHTTPSQSGNDVDFIRLHLKEIEGEDSDSDERTLPLNAVGLWALLQYVLMHELKLNSWNVFFTMHDHEKVCHAAVNHNSACAVLLNNI